MPSRALFPAALLLVASLALAPRAAVADGSGEPGAQDGAGAPPAPEAVAPAPPEEAAGADAEPLPAAAEDAIPHVASEPPLEDDLLLEEEWLYEEEPDPLEPGNRVIFGFNEGVYRFLLDPIADVYEFVVPKPVRTSVRRFFTNLREPGILVNAMFQRRADKAAGTGARFVVNSTVGLAGLFDPASRIGLDAYETDFGQTLALYGVPDGAYMVVPVMGPATVRDFFGAVVDAGMRPDAWVLSLGPQILFVTGDGFTGYQSKRVLLEELRQSSLDFYAAMRSAYRMDRAARLEAMIAEIEAARQERAVWAAHMAEERELLRHRSAPRRASPRWRSGSFQQQLEARRRAPSAAGSP